jgi:hypothetical protein
MEGCKMSKTGTVRARIEPRLKKEAEHVLEDGEYLPKAVSEPYAWEHIGSLPSLLIDNACTD